MKEYTLTASRDGWSQSITFPANSESDATIQAVFEIMNRASANDTSSLKHKAMADVWARGYIELVDPSGNVIQTMDAK